MGLAESGLRRATGSSRNRSSLAKTAYALASARSPEFEKLIPKKIKKKPRQKVVGSLVAHEMNISCPSRSIRPSSSSSGTHFAGGLDDQITILVEYFSLFAGQFSVPTASIVTAPIGLFA